MQGDFGHKEVVYVEEINGGDVLDAAGTVSKE